MSLLVYLLTKTVVKDVTAPAMLTERIKTGRTALTADPPAPSLTILVSIQATDVPTAKSAHLMLLLLHLKTKTARQDATANAIPINWMKMVQTAAILFSANSLMSTHSFQAGYVRTANHAHSAN